jgi:hypothetical protein
VSANEAMGCNHWQRPLQAMPVGSLLGLVSTWAPLLTGTMSGAGATQRRVQRSSSANWRAASAWTGHALSAACTSPRLQARPSLGLYGCCGSASLLQLAISIVFRLRPAECTAHASYAHLQYVLVGRGLAAAAGATQRGTRPGALRAASAAAFGGLPRQPQRAAHLLNDSQRL